jgi:hypothetical protein
LPRWWTDDGGFVKAFSWRNIGRTMLADTVRRHRAATYLKRNREFLVDANRYYQFDAVLSDERPCTYIYCTS